MKTEKRIESGRARAQISSGGKKNSYHGHTIKFSLLVKRKIVLKTVKKQPWTMSAFWEEGKGGLTLDTRLKRMIEFKTRGGYSHIKVTGVLVSFFESDPLKVPSSCFCFFNLSYS